MAASIRRTAAEAELPPLEALHAQVMQEERANQHATQVVEARMRNIDAFRRSAEIAEGQGNLQRAEQYSTSMIELIEYSLESFACVMISNAYFNRAGYRLYLGRYYEAIKDLDSAFEHNPVNPSIRYLRGLAHKKVGNRSLALEDFLASQGDRETDFCAKVQIAFAKRRFQQVLALFDPERDLPQVRQKGALVLSDLFTMRGIALEALHRSDEAAAAYTNGIEYAKELRDDKTPLADLHLLRGFALREQNKEREAAKDLKEARKLYGTYVPATFAEKENAVALAMRDLLLSPEQKRNASLLALARIYRDGSDQVAQNEEISRKFYCMAIDVPCQEAQLIRASMFLEIKDFIKSGLLFRQIMEEESHPDRREAAYQLGCMYEEEKMPSDHAFGQARDAYLVSIALQNPLAMVSLGTMYYAGKIHENGTRANNNPSSADTQEAFSLLRRAHEMRQEDGTIAYLRGRCYYDGRAVTDRNHPEVRPDYAGAFALFIEAEQHQEGMKNDVKAQLFERLSIMSYHGQGIPKPNFPEALRYAALFQRFHPGSRKAHLYLGLIRTFSMGETRNHEAALQHFSHDSLREDVLAVHLLKNVYRWSGRLDQANELAPRLRGQRVPADAAGRIFSSVAAADDGTIVLGYLRRINGTAHQYLESGRLDAQGRITWVDQTSFPGVTDGPVRLAMRGDHTVVMVRHEEQKLYYDLIRLTAERRFPQGGRNWRYYDDGINPVVTMEGETILDMHRAEKKPLIYSRIGKLAGDAITWDVSHETWFVHPGVENSEHVAVTLHGGRVVTVADRTDTSDLAYQAGNIGDWYWKGPYNVPSSARKTTPQITYLHPNRVCVVAKDRDSGQLDSIYATMNLGDNTLTWDRNWTSYDVGSESSVASVQGQLVEFHEFSEDTGGPSRLCRGVIGV